jgi:glycosyltransferase involved in cell wall biosynthesis
MANPSADVYGADLQLLESVRALRDRGWRVVVVVPSTGPLVDRLHAAGAVVELLPYPVLRRADLSPRGIATLFRASGSAMLGIRRLLRRQRPALVLVNTITLPWWLLVTRLSGVPSICHVHEAESQDPALVRRMLAVQLTLADATVVNSRATLAVTAAAAPYLRPRLRLVSNGVRGPAAAPTARPPGSPFRLLVAGRITPRKAPHVAIEATALLRAAGRDVALEICGTPGPGHEGYFAELCARAAQTDLAGSVTFSGYQAPLWPALERTDVLLAPSTGESFGNAVVEGQLARRPVVATAVQGHLETVEHRMTGLLVPNADAGAMAAAVARLMDRPRTARELAFLGMRGAEARFGIDRYGEEIAAAVAEVAGAAARAALTAVGSHLDVVETGDELLQGEPQESARGVRGVAEVDDLHPHLPEAPL